jgi:hypothetical protein
MKKVLAILSAVAMVLTLAACNDPKDNPGEGENPTDPWAPYQVTSEEPGTTPLEPVINSVAAYEPDLDISSPELFRAHIDVLETEGGFTTIAGWAVYASNLIEEFDSAFVLIDTRDESFLLLETSMVERNDVTVHFEEEYGLNFDKSGMGTTFSNEHLTAPYSDYKVLILYRNDEHNLLVDTGRVLAD